MPKHRKTREEKIRTNLRHEHAQQITNPLTQSGSFSYSFQNTQTILQKEVGTDVQQKIIKSALVSVAILLVQFLFFALLKIHVLAIPFVRY